MNKQYLISPALQYTVYTSCTAAMAYTYMPTHYFQFAVGKHVSVYGGSSVISPGKDDDDDDEGGIFPA